ncbi:MAG: DNA-processing protein DprA [Saccharofermentans sp.]|nr:DNA-processing protein DprA [Saccharofermentans sp.]
MEIETNRDKDFFYSAVMLNTKVNSRVLNELTEQNVINNYRDLSDRELLKMIIDNKFKLGKDTVDRIKNLYESYRDVVKTVLGYKKIADVNGIEVISILDSCYPYNWKVQNGMPKVFYSKGDFSILDRMTLSGSVAVVGSRNPSKYALYATDMFCKELGSKGVTVISGMAYGTDRQAHISSVFTKGGTIAVLAGGADNIYPMSNKDIYEQICCNGLIVTEMPPGQLPLRQYFPSRNRLIAGLSDCTLIMEAGSVSGTLHTASFAAAQGKEVFVLPNNIYYENALGGLKLLEDGGNILLNTDSVIDSIARSVMFKRMDMGCPGELYYQEAIEKEYGESANIDALRELSRIKPEVLSDDNWKLLIKDSLTLKPLCADEICTVTSLPFYRVSKLLTELELNGTVCQEKGKYSLTFV